MKIRIFAAVMFAILIATGAWSSHSAESRCAPPDVKVMQGAFGIIAG